MNAHTRQTIRPKRIRATLCPDCGQYCRFLNAATGFCQACTNEHRRGGPITPNDHRYKT